MFQGGVFSEDGGAELTAVSCGNLRGCVNGELHPGLLAIIDRETFHQWGDKPRMSSPSKAVENQESLNICALLGQFFNLIQEKVIISLPMV